MSETDQLKALLGEAEEHLRGVLALAIQYGALTARDAWVVGSHATLAKMERVPQMFRPCPHPARKGRHEEYLAANGSTACRACGARTAERIRTVAMTASDNEVAE